MLLQCDGRLVSLIILAAQIVFALNVPLLRVMYYVLLFCQILWNSKGDNRRITLAFSGFSQVVLLID